MNKNNKITKRPLKYKREKGSTKYIAYYDEKLKKYVRKNAFGIKEYLDPKTYIESLKTEKYYNELLEKYLNACQNVKRKTY